MRIRPATAEDIAAFSGLPSKPTIRAWVGEADGKVIALAGFAFSKGRWLAFCDLRPEARKYKMALARGALRAFAEIKRQGIKYVYAEVDPDEPGAVRWLTSLGFTVDPRNVYLWRWKA